MPSEKVFEIVYKLEGDKEYRIFKSTNSPADAGGFVRDCLNQFSDSILEAKIRTKPDPDETLEMKLVISLLHQSLKDALSYEWKGPATIRAQCEEAMIQARKFVTKC